MSLRCNRLAGAVGPIQNWGAIFPAGTVENRKGCPTEAQRMDYSAVEETFIDLSLRAGSLILDAFNAPEIETSWKDDGSPVTAADLAADELIREGLKQAFPGTLVVSEENSGSHAGSASRFFLVDPLDGTSGFRRRKTEFTVNIALIEDGIPVMGVVHAPAMGRHFCTDAGGKVVERSVDPEASSCRVVARHAVSGRNNSAVRVVASRALRSDSRMADFLKGIQVRNVEVMSSSIKFCLIAAHEADLYPRFGRTMEWDTAAGHAILRAVGGRLVRFDDRQVLEYGKPGFENPGFIAHAPGTVV